MTEPAVIDADSHLHEPRTMWRDYIDPGLRELALVIEDDELGYSWLSWRGRRLYLAEVQSPGRAAEIGEDRQRLERGEVARHRYDEMLPPEYTDPIARSDKLGQWGIDGSIVFPNFGLLWEQMLADDPIALCANMGAANRWMADVARSGRGRLFPVAHLTLRDRNWVISQLRQLAAAGIKLAMVAPAPVDSKALSHRDLDPVWAAFCEYDVAPVFHVANFPPPLHPAWYQGDPEPVDKLMSSLFLWVAPAAAIASMIIQGTLERFPALRIGVIELTAQWVPYFLLTLDGASDFYAARHGRPLVPLRLRPSEYFLQHVRVGCLAYEDPAQLVGLAGEGVFMFGSDWPHAEGIADPLGDYQRMAGNLGGSARRALFGGNARWLLNN